MPKVVEHLAIPSQDIKVEISIGQDVFKTELYAAIPKFPGRTAIIADSKIAPTYGTHLQKQTGAALFPFSRGEKGKTRETKQRFEDKLLKEGFGRDTLLIGLGGGVVTDFTAFLASTYMRGVPLMLVPTTLLAMVDAAIGGKTGVDTPFGKNLIGTIYQPSRIFIDPSLLDSLPAKEWTYGLAEILKCGLIADAAIWQLLEKDPGEWKKSVHSLILSSIRVKKQVVEKDPLETFGYRRILNFGHTIGHALETLSKYRIPHGQAVAIGLLAESRLSHRLGYLSASDLSRIQSLLCRFPFSFKLSSSYSARSLFKAMRIDKKAKGGEPRFVLIDRIGHALPFDGEYCRTIPHSELETLCLDI